MVAPVRVPVRRIRTGDRLLDEAQRLAQDSARKINQGPFVSGVLIDSEPGGIAGAGVSFSAGAPRSIAHGLGRKATGCFEVYAADVASAALVGLFTSAHPAGITSSTHVTVTPTNSGTCFLFVF